MNGELKMNAGLRRGAWRALAALALSTSLGGCGVDRLATGSIVPESVNARHPIALVEQANNLSIFPSAYGIDGESFSRVKQFAAAYRTNGQGQIEILTPRGGANHFDVNRAVTAIRHALAAGGARGFVSIAPYPVLDPTNVAPIRVSYIGLKARVANRCGEWPQDLASGSSLDGWENRPYWNFGCAYQSEIAAQVADPRDLVEPRATGPSDVTMRTRAIGNVRTGADPGTNWKVQNTSISNVGSN